MSYSLIRSTWVAVLNSVYASPSLEPSTFALPLPLGRPSR